MEYRIGNLEFRWIKFDTDFPDDYERPEIVKWEYSESYKREFCCTLAIWTTSEEGYDLKFIGNRPFSDKVDKNIFWELAKYGQNIVDSTFELEEWKKNNEQFD